MVVNCFHFSVSLGYKTTSFSNIVIEVLLWIAFIFQYLWDTKQHLLIPFYYAVSCELLSFFSIFGIQNNTPTCPFIIQIVVNCFHFSVSLGYKTTNFKFLFVPFRLWIAFIFQYLWDTKQRKCGFFPTVACCELLSFFSIFGIQNNILGKHYITIVVVNCFHFSVSLGYKTTELELTTHFALLWIAFIFQYLWDTKQQMY